jgi:hypothetical protein
MILYSRYFVKKQLSFTGANVYKELEIMKNKKKHYLCAHFFLKNYNDIKKRKKG